MPWSTILGGSISLQGLELAKISECTFSGERPYETEKKSLAEVVRECLLGSSGHFVLSGKASDELLDAIRKEAELTLRCVTSRGEVEAEIKADPDVARTPNAAITASPFTVTGEVWFTERT